jgi:O-antigen ligase
VSSAKNVVFGIIIFDVFILASLLLFSWEITLSLAIVLLVAISFFVSPLGYIYFLVLWGLYESILIPESFDLRGLRLLILVLILLLAWGKFWLSGRKLKLPSKIISVPIAAFYIWAGFTVLTAPVPLTSLLEFLKLSTYLSIFILTYNLINSVSDAKKVFYFFIIASLPVFIISLHQSFLLGVLRPNAIFGNANTLGIYCFVIAALTLILFKMEIRSFIRRASLLSFFILAFLILLLSNSRASLLGMVVFILFYLIFYKHYKVLSICLVLGIIGLIYFSKSNSLLNDLNQSTRLLEGTTGRTLLWSRSIPMIKEYLLFGVGIGSVSEVFHESVNTTHPIFAHLLKHAVERGFLHNAYLQKAAELGLLGLILFFWANINFIRYLRKLLTEKQNVIVVSAAIAMLSMLLARLAHSFFESIYIIGPFSPEVGMIVMFAPLLRIIQLQTENRDMPA